MTNQYQILKDRQQKEFNAFPMGAAFSQQQFAEMMEKWGLLPTDTDKIVHIGGGCYIRKTDREAFRALVERLEKEKADALAADTTGEGIIKDMFLYELANHEYCDKAFSSPRNSRLSALISSTVSPTASSVSSRSYVMQYS